MKKKKKEMKERSQKGREFFETEEERSNFYFSHLISLCRQTVELSSLSLFSPKNLRKVTRKKREIEKEKREMKKREKERIQKDEGSGSRLKNVTSANH